MCWRQPLNDTCTLKSCSMTRWGDLDYWLLISFVILGLFICCCYAGFMLSEKSAQRRCTRCPLAVVRGSQIFSPCRRPPSHGRGTGKILSAWDGHYLHLQMQFGEDRVIVVTDPQTNKHTNRQGRLQYTAPQLSAVIILLGLEPVSLMIKKSRMRWFGHVDQKDDDDDNNNNNHNDIYSAVIMTRSLREFTRFIWWM